MHGKQLLMEITCCALLVTLHMAVRSHLIPTQLSPASQLVKLAALSMLLALVVPPLRVIAMRVRQVSS